MTARFHVRYHSSVSAGPFPSFKPPKVKRQRFAVTRPLPREIVVSFWILVARLVLSLVRLAVRIVGFNWGSYLATTVHSFEDHGRQLQVTPGLAIFLVVSSFVVGIFSIASWVALALLLRRGLGWVRILLSIFALFQVVTIIFSLPHRVDLVEIAQGAATAAAVVLLWVPSSNQFSGGVKSDRRLHRARQLD